LFNTALSYNHRFSVSLELIGFCPFGKALTI
jgi:hypothetical protein